MIESLLSELSASGWTISWAFQFAPSEWRLSIIHEEDVGAMQGTYISSCASAPTFAEALEDAMSKMNEAEFESAVKQGYAAEKSKGSLLEVLGLKKEQRFDRRV